MEFVSCQASFTPSIPSRSAETSTLAKLKAQCRFCRRVSSDWQRTGRRPRHGDGGEFVPEELGRQPVCGAPHLGQCLNIFSTAFSTISWFLLPLFFKVSSAMPRQTRLCVFASYRSTIKVPSTFCCGVMPPIPPPIPRMPQALQDVSCFRPPLLVTIRSGF